jgi:hypothetical protein
MDQVLHTDVSRLMSMLPDEAAYADADSSGECTLQAPPAPLHCRRRRHYDALMMRRARHLLATAPQ